MEGVGFRAGGSWITYIYIYVYVYVYISVYIYIYIYLCVCVPECLWSRRGIFGQGKRQLGSLVLQRRKLSAMGCMISKKVAVPEPEVMVPLTDRRFQQAKEEQENQLRQIGQHELEILCYP